MKKTVLVLLLLLPLSMAQAQLSGDYVADFTKGVKFYLSFTSDGLYYCDIIKQITIGMQDKRTMSIGSYTVEDKKVFLKDRVHNFEMELQIVDDSLKMEKSFCFLKDKVFGLKSAYVEMFTFEYLKGCDSTFIKNERVEYKAQHQKQFPLDYGDYISNYQYDALRYCMTLKENNSYRIYFEDLLISEGTWQRDGVELILYDTSLNHRFYLMIDDKKLISKYLPGDYDSDELERKCF